MNFQPKIDQFFILTTQHNFQNILAKLEPKPLLPTGISDVWHSLDLSINNPKLLAALNKNFANLEEYQVAMTNFIKKECQGAIGYGGYMERRNLYEKSPYFVTTGTPRCIHLGLDIWQAAGTPFYLPLDGEIHSFQINEQPLDYGGTIITRHNIGDFTFHLLFGHLAHESLAGLAVGQRVAAGEQLCRLGAPKENGGWPPHLHFQVILDMEGMKGDYPGVATEAEAERYRGNCPDPLFLVEGFFGRK